MKSSKAVRLLLGLVVLAAAGVARADEGMWTFDRFPSQKVREKYGFGPDKAWLDHVRLSSVRLARGCSGSLVSGSGLVLTNHHCARSCIQQLSTRDRDLMRDGFFARTPADELRCPEIEIDQLLEITDVTGRMNAATRGLSDRAFLDAQKAETARIEKECASGDTLRCDVVPLYHGGLYHLYKYRRYQDVRLVFSPEAAIAHFGGDPDNFRFPRYAFDISFLRIYDDGKPARTPEHLRWSLSPVEEGDLVFVSGNPARTSRLYTVAELEYERDAALPRRLLRLAEMRGLLTRFREEGPERKRISMSSLLRVENSLKGLRGRFEALLDKDRFAARAAEEADFRVRVAADPALKEAYGGAWDAIARAKDKERTIQRRYAALETGGGLGSSLMGFARTLVRAAEELPKPDKARLREYTDSKLPALKQKLFSTAPVYDDLESLNLTFSLTKLREDLGPDAPLVKKILGKSSPREVAAALVRGTGLKDVALRRRLFQGGLKSVGASKDPMIRMAMLVDSEARPLRKKYEDEIESVLKANDELVARAHFAVEGTSTYPDATFTLRLSYGQVKGFPRDGKEVAPLTKLAGLFERATGSEPFGLPRRWLSARKSLALGTPLDFSTTNDIIGGNSGSPVIDREGRFAGVIFDGNLPSLAGDYWYDASVNRAVAVDGAAVLEALKKVYGAGRILNEILAEGVGAGKREREAR